MNNHLAYLLFRTGSRVIGSDPVKDLAWLVSSQRWGRDAIQAYQRAELKALLEFARRQSTFYASRVPAPGADGGVPVERTLEKIPVLTKEEMRRAGPQLRAVGARRVFEISTSGSTGTPLILTVDREAFGRYFAAKLRALSWYGVRFSDRQLRVWGLTSRRGRYIWHLRDKLQNRLRLQTFDLSDRAVGRIVDRCDRFRPDYVNGYTSGIARVAEYLLEHSVDVSKWRVKVVLPTSETLLPPQRQLMEKAFRAPVANEYGCGEVQAIAYECPAGSFHVTHENLILELLDEGGSPVPPGQQGLVTLTSLVNRSTPLIRYQNGDLAVWSERESCPCGVHSGMPLLERVVGRSADVLRLPDGTVSHWTLIYYAIKDTLDPGTLMEHQAHQLAIDRFRLLAVKGPAFNERVFAQFLERLQRDLGSQTTVEVEFVESIDREASGKLRYFVSELHDP